MNLKNTVILLVFSFISQSLFAQEVEADKIFEYVEVMPEFPGGEDAMIGFLSSNINFPKSALADSTFSEETVLIDFVVNKKGKITRANIKKSNCRACGREALRVVKSMPNWKVGKQNGKAVKVRYTLPIQFVSEE